MASGVVIESYLDKVVVVGDNSCANQVLHRGDIVLLNFEYGHWCFFFCDREPEES